MNILQSMVYLILFLLATSHSENALTTKEVPLYIRESWLKVCQPHLAYCIADTKVDPSNAFRSLKFAELSSNACLKCWVKCICVRLNLMDATTGDLVEKEYLRQVEGVTPEIFKKCNDLAKDYVDLCNKAFTMYMCIINSVAVPKTPSHHSVHQDEHY